MNAIILAAGSGERLKPYTESLPKGMLEVGGKTLIERQIDQFRSIGIEDITVATGFQAEAIDYEDVRYTHNPEYSSTNMVETLMSARASFIGEVLVSYADIAVDDRVIDTVVRNDSDTGVVVDTTWRDYWAARYAQPESDLESLKLNDRGEITEIGKPTDSSIDIDGRYVGLMKFSPQGAHNFLSIYDEAKAQFWDQPWQSSSLFQKAYMTDMLQALINDRFTVNAVRVEGGWLEFDTVGDYRLFAEPLAAKYGSGDDQHQERAESPPVYPEGYTFLQHG